MRGEAHALLAASDHDIGIAGRNLLGADGDGPKTRAADLVQSPGGLLHRNAGADGGLAGRILALSGGQHLTQDHFVDIGRLHMRPFQRRANGDLPKGMRREARQGAIERADRRPRRADNNDIFVLHSHLHFPN